METWGKKPNEQILRCWEEEESLLESDTVTSPCEQGQAVNGQGWGCSWEDAGSMSKGKVLHISQGNPTHKHRLG